MRRGFLALFVLVLLLAFPVISRATTFRSATTYEGYRAAADSCLVEFESVAAPAAVAQRLAGAGYPVRQISLIEGRVVFASDRAGFASLEMLEVSHAVVDLDASRDLAEQLDEIATIPGVRAVWPNYIHHISYTPNDPYYGGYQGNFRQIYVDKAWNLSTGEGATVAVIDTGYRKSGLEDKVKNLLTGYDFWGNDNNVNDYIGHGTHISNTVAERTNNGIGCAGIAFDARVMPCKVFPDYDEGALESDIIDAIYWAVNNGADVINMSLGGGGYVSSTRQAISYAVSNEVIVFAASGNAGTSPVEYPAAYDDCIAVGATERHSVGGTPVKASFSNYGTALDIVAPGVEITQETWDSSYGVDYYAYDGTSSATPHAAATAALMVAYGGADAAKIRDAIESTARGTSHNWNQKLGWGEIDAYAALVEYGGAADNEAPKAVADASPTSGGAPLDVHFDGSDSSDPDGSIVSYTWVIEESSKVISSSKEFNYTFDDPGVYTVSLTVKDDGGKTDSDSVTITVGGSGDDDDGDTDLGDDRCANLLEVIYYGCEYAISNSSGLISPETAYSMCENDDPSSEVWDCLFSCQGNENVTSCANYRECAKDLCGATLADIPSGGDDDDDSVGYSCGL